MKRMAFSVQFLTVTLLLCILYHTVYPRHAKEIKSNRLDYENKRDRARPDIYEDGFNPRESNLSAKKLDSSQYKQRNTLPPEVLTFRSDLYKLDCNGFYLMTENGFITFKLDSPDQACKYIFAGSIMEKCTAAIICKGKVNDSGESSTSCRNDNDYFEISDASRGKEKVCGSSNFDQIPKVARNNGTDLFVTYKASSKSAVCTVFCAEDVKQDDSTLKKLRPLRRNRSKRRKTEAECVCGKLNLEGRVVNGENAGKFEFPWIAPIVEKIPTGNSRSPICAASLINDRYALTAAHCFKRYTWAESAEEVQLIFHSHVMDRTWFGNPNNPKLNKIPGWNLPNETDFSERSIRANVEKVILHPKYDWQLTGLDFDIAILKLKGRIKLKANKVLPVCLPEVYDRYVDYTGKNMTVAGWGYVEEDLHYTARILQKLEMRFAPREQCSRNDQPTKRHICAGFWEGGKDACQGDSGGPLIAQLDGGDNQYHLAGVVSGGNGCAKKGHYGLYTNVQELVQWVYHITQDGIFCSKK